MHDAKSFIRRVWTYPSTSLGCRICNFTGAVLLIDSIKGVQGMSRLWVIYRAWRIHIREFKLVVMLGRTDIPGPSANAIEHGAGGGT